jgi:acetyl-CoA synthetase
VNLDALAEAIARVSEMAADLADVLEELDVNPLRCDGERVVAVDALIVQRRPA